MKGRRKSILIVEDLENWRHVFSSILKNEYDIQVVGSYDEAICLIQDGRFSFELVITDIRLDDMSVTDEAGLRLLEKISKGEQYVSTIVVTGYPSIETVRDAVKFDAFDYIEKYPDGGFNIEHFRETVSKAINHAAERRAVTELLNR